MPTFWHTNLKSVQLSNKKGEKMKYITNNKNENLKINSNNTYLVIAN